jgi:hypothetical protein
MLEKKFPLEKEKAVISMRMMVKNIWILYKVLPLIR